MIYKNTKALVHILMLFYDFLLYTRQKRRKQSNEKEGKFQNHMNNKQSFQIFLQTIFFIRFCCLLFVLEWFFVDFFTGIFGYLVEFWGGFGLNCAESKEQAGSGENQGMAVLEPTILKSFLTFKMRNNSFINSKLPYLFK